MIQPNPTINNKSGADWWPWIAALAVIVLFAGIGLRDPWPADEPRFAQVAREMVESGQWLFPTRGGEFYPDKPPVFMWLIALFYILTGHLKIAFLLPSALAGLGTLWLVLDLGRRLWGPDVARSALLVLVFTPQFLLQAKTAQIDALVCFWITLGCYGLIRHFVLGPSWGWYAASWIAMALGIMTKGVGFLPLLMLPPLALWVRRPGVPRAQQVWTARALWGPVLMLATLALWLVPMWLTVERIHSPELLAYRDNILFRQTAERYANAWHHIKPWHYYLSTAIPSVWLPLALLCLLEVRRIKEMWSSSAVLRVLLVWVALVIVFFSLSSGKREVYILPALPMLALAFASVWERSAGHNRWTPVLLRSVVVGLGLLLLAIGAVALFAPGHLPAKADEYADAVNALAPGLALLGIALPALVWLLRRRDLFEQLALVSLLVWLFVAFWVWPTVNPHRTPREIVQEVEQTVPPDAEIGMLAFKEQFLLFASRPLVHFSYLAPLEQQEWNAWRWMREDASRVLLAHEDLELKCFDLSKKQVLGSAHRRDWILLDSSSLRERCPAAENRKPYRYVPTTKDML